MDDYLKLIQQNLGYIVDRLNYSYTNRNIELFLRSNENSPPSRILLFNECMFFQLQGLVLFSLDSVNLFAPPGIAFFHELSNANLNPNDFMEIHLTSNEKNIFYRPVHSYRGLRLTCKSVQLFNC